MGNKRKKKYGTNKDCFCIDDYLTKIKKLKKQNKEKKQGIVYE